MRASLRRVVPARMKTEVKRFLGMPLTRLHPDWNVLAPIGPCEREHVILDIGAHHGWFFHCWLDWCPQGRVHAFEPYSESFQRMLELYGDDPRVRLHQLGVGDKAGELTLNVLEDSKVSNSFLPPTPATWNEIRFSTGAIT